MRKKLKYNWGSCQQLGGCMCCTYGGGLAPPDEPICELTIGSDRSTTLIRVCHDCLGKVCDLAVDAFNAPADA